MTTVKQLEKIIQELEKTQNEVIENLTEINKKLEDHQKRFELIYKYNENHEKLRHQSENRNRPVRNPDNDYYDEYENRRHYNEYNR